MELQGCLVFSTRRNSNDKERHESANPGPTSTVYETNAPNRKSMYLLKTVSELYVNKYSDHLIRLETINHITVETVLKVLKQVDEKFILCVMKSASVKGAKDPDLLVVLDQHAAHERVRLEQLTSSK